MVSSKIATAKPLALFKDHYPQSVGLDWSGDGSWDFAGVDTQYSTHGLHTYVAAMIPQLAKRLIDVYVPQKGVVFDPFCGGGAVLVEAILFGREATGADVNHLAALVSKAKTTHIQRSVIEEMGRSALSEAGQYDG